MRSFIAAVIAAAVCSLQAQALAFHVHAVSDHSEDRDHQHGPAIHHHDDFDSVRHVDEDERSAVGAVITVAVPAATTSAVIAAVAVFAEALPTPDLQLIGDARTIDVRSHGPPQSRTDFLRGPPASIQS